MQNYCNGILFSVDLEGQIWVSHVSTLENKI